MRPEALLDGIKFPEGLRWHAGHLWFADIHDHRVCRIDGAGRATTVAEFDDMPSGLGWLRDGTLLVVLMRSRRIVKVVDGTILPHADLTAYVGDHLNDMVVDENGIAYAGVITWRGFSDEAMDGRTQAVRDCVVRITPDGTTSIAAEDMIGPNGSAITADGKILIVAETRALRVTTFDLDPSGLLTNRRTFADLDPMRADGIALDAEGALWCGLGSCFGRVVEGGEVVERIEIEDGTTAVACALGGDDRKTLFLATCRTTTENLSRIHHTGGTFDDEVTSDAQGWIETIQVPVPGVGIP